MSASTIQIAQRWGDIESWKRPKWIRLRSQFSMSSLLSGTSLILSLSQIRARSTPWLLMLLSPSWRWTCSKQKLWARLLKLISSDTYRAESQAASSTLSRRRNSRPWRLATRGSHSFYYYLSFQKLVALCVSGWGAWTLHNLQQPMVLYLHRAAALAWIQERSSQKPWYRYVCDSTLPCPSHQASWLYTLILGQGNIDN